MADEKQTPGPAGTGAGPGVDAVVWLTPSTRLRTVRLTQLAAVVGPLLVIDLVAGAVVGSGPGMASGAGGLIAAAAAAFYFIARRIRAWGYAERDDDLLVRRGVMFQRLSIIPYGRMQYVDVTSGPFERSFGLATVRMYTAAAASDARIPGLPSAEAARLRDNLTAMGEARATGL